MKQTQTRIIKQTTIEHGYYYAQNAIHQLGDDRERHVTFESMLPPQSIPQPVDKSGRYLKPGETASGYLPRPGKFVVTIEFIPERD